MPGAYVPKVTSFLDWASPDKIVHFILFGGLAYLILYGYRDYLNGGEKSLGIIITAILIATLYGLLTEVLQHYVFIGRNGNIFDFVADAIGAVIGFLAFYLLNIKKTNRNYVDKD